MHRLHYHRCCANFSISHPSLDLKLEFQSLIILTTHERRVFTNRHPSIFTQPKCVHFCLNYQGLANDVSAIHYQRIISVSSRPNLCKEGCRSDCWPCYRHRGQPLMTSHTHRLRLSSEYQPSNFAALSSAITDFDLHVGDAIVSFSTVSRRCENALVAH